jgi:hypothetical protein
MLEKEKVLEEIQNIHKMFTGQSNFSMTDLSESLNTIETAYLEAIQCIDILEDYIDGECTRTPCPKQSMTCLDCCIKIARKEIKESNDTPNNI